ncbi:hypothetical protein B0J14DRAFT_658221 [Halenospora varia]|nr:hypothetical protein B0J14DRAFT_658221 [Halenospora varia]
MSLPNMSLPPPTILSPSSLDASPHAYPSETFDLTSLFHAYDARKAAQSKWMSYFDGHMEWAGEPVPPSPTTSSTSYPEIDDRDAPAVDSLPESVVEEETRSTGASPTQHSPHQSPAQRAPHSPLPQSAHRPRSLKRTPILSANRNRITKHYQTRSTTALFRTSKPPPKVSRNITRANAAKGNRSVAEVGPRRSSRRNAGKKRAK